MQMRKSKRVLIIVIFLMVLALVFPSACTTTEPEVGNNRWVELLNVLPANESTFNGAYLRDDAFKAEMAQKYPQVESPLYPDDSAFLIPLFGDSPNAYSDEAWQVELGFVRADVDKTIYAGIPPIASYQASYGRFDRSKIDDAVKNGPYKVVPETIAYQGYDYYSWGGDNEISLRLRTPVRPLGKGHRLALIDKFLFWVPKTNQMQEMIDSYADKIDSLADIKSYQQLAITLAEANTFRAFFSSVSYSPDNIKEQYKSVFEQQENMSDPMKRFTEEIQRTDIPLLKPFEAIATGVGVNEKGYYLIIALHNSSTSVAKKNAPLLEQRIKQSIEPYSGKTWQNISSEIEVSYEGQVTIAKLYGEAAKQWNQFAIQGFGMLQPLVMHE
jgi:hypothetical protein